VVLGGFKNRKQRRQEALEAIAAWQKEDLPDVSATVAELAATAADRELKSRDALNGRLANTITVCGALLAAAFALSKNAADLKIHGAADTAFAIAFAAAVALLVVAILLCVGAIRPEPRHRLSAELARYWSRQEIPDGEARTDVFKLDVALLDQLAAGNTRRAYFLRRAQYFLVGALISAAVGALVIFFD
jgi:hypothetical protein